MNVEQKYFLELIASEVFERPVDVCEDVDWKEIFRLSKIHNLMIITFSAVNRLPASHRPPEKILARMKKDFLLGLHHSNNIENYTKKIILKFEQDKIEHVLIKGYVLKSYYPKAEYRSMSDVDILVKKEDKERANEAMLSLGYENVLQDEIVSSYKKKSSFIELHTELMEEAIKSEADFNDYFSKAWDNRQILSKNYSYTLEKNYHLIYLLAHMAKHFYSCGCGVRMIMDIAVFLEKFSDELDLEYVFGELEKIKLDLFTRNIMILCNKWFGTKVNFSYELEPEFYEALATNILEGGTFGFNTSNFKIARIRNESEEKSYEGSLITILKNIIIPSYEVMIKHSEYSFLKNRRYLIAPAWVYRWFYQLRTKGFGAVAYIFKLLSSKKDIKSQRDTLKRLGL